jgi:hypothetical protein
MQSNEKPPAGWWGSGLNLEKDKKLIFFMVGFVTNIEPLGLLSLANENCYHSGSARKNRTTLPAGVL